MYVISPTRRGRRKGSVRRLFAIYAVVSLVPVVLLGAVLLTLLHRQGQQHGMAEGRAKADLIARTSIAPLLSGGDLRPGLAPGEKQDLGRSVMLAVHDREVLRLRLRDLSGTIVFADDGTTGPADDESLEAAGGETVVHLTWLNDDEGDTGPRGPRVVEIYQPLLSAQTGERIGVLEVYLPYAPIAADISAGQRSVAMALTGGLALLWLCLLAVSASVTRRLRRQAAVNAFLASHDALTRMPNRARFAERAAQAVEVSSPEHPVAVAVVDLDRFKEVNDTLGHATGDELLIQLADRLRGAMREGDTIARLGGDEFGVVLTGISGPREANELLGRLRAVLSEPLHVNGLPLAVEASVGFAMAPIDGADVGVLLQRADVAMYVAKAGHRGVVHYEPEQDHYDASTLRLVAELGTAIAEDQLVLHYQPKGDLHPDNEHPVIAVEALVRWQHPTRGLLYPDSFVPAAEQTELIEDLTRWVLRRATSMLPGLDPTGRLSVAVNISARSLGRADFATDVLDALTETGTDPGRVILEITETSLMDDPGRAAHTLHELHRAGLRISIDDFGAGHTSLSYLAALPISELKIDKGFVLAMYDDGRTMAIVRSVIELGHSLGFTVTAEGVETAAILDGLTSLGCDTVQGYLLARPTTCADLGERMAAATEVLMANRESRRAGSGLATR
jgi:diguanylate cyclase (GGDEF)-like protein